MSSSSWRISSVGPVHVVGCAQTSHWVRVMLAVRQFSQFIVLLMVSPWYRNVQDVRGPQSTVRRSIMGAKAPVIGIRYIDISHVLAACVQERRQVSPLLKGVRHESICGRQRKGLVQPRPEINCQGQYDRGPENDT